MACNPVSYRQKEMPVDEFLSSNWTKDYAEFETGLTPIFEGSPAVLNDTDRQDVYSNFYPNNAEGIPGRNGSWYGVHHPYQTIDRAWTIAWSFGLDRFIDHLWKERFPYLTGFDFLEAFKNETDIEANPANLFFQARSSFLKNDRGVMAVHKTECKVRQEYTESRVLCSQSSSQRGCQVVAQRPSKIPHAPESISILSDPGVFGPLSDEIPRSMWKSGVQAGEATLSYLYSPSMTGNPEPTLLEALAQT